MPLFEFPGHGRGASPNRPGIFIYKYLQGQIIEYPPLSISGRPEESISELHRKYKSLYKPVSLRKKGKRKVATYHSFNAYFQRLIRMGWVEFVREIESVAHQFTRRGNWPQKIPDERPKQKFYKLTPRGISLSENYWAFPQHYYNQFLAGMPFEVPRPVAPLIPAPPIPVHPPRRARITPPAVITPIPEVKPKRISLKRVIRERAIPAGLITLEEIKNSYQSIGQRIIATKEDWVASWNVERLIPSVKGIETDLKNLIQKVDEAIKATRGDIQGAYKLQRQPLTHVIDYFNDLYNQVSSYQRETLERVKASYAGGVATLLDNILTCCQ